MENPEISRGGVLPQEPPAESSEVVTPENLDNENPEDISRGGILPQKPPDGIENRNPGNNLRGGTLLPHNDLMQQRRHFPGLGRGKKWREIALGDDGKFKLRVVVDKGVEISSRKKSVCDQILYFLVGNHSGFTYSVSKE